MLWESLMHILALKLFHISFKSGNKIQHSIDISSYHEMMLHDKHTDGQSLL